MESDSFALRTAFFTLLAVAVLSVSWMLLKQKRGDVNTYLVVTNQSINGMALQSRVYYKGVEVGAVEEIYFLDDNYNQVHILISVDASIPLASNTYAQLALRGITAEYDLRLENEGDLGIALITSKDNPARIEMRPGFISTLGNAVESTLAEVRKASERLAELLAENNQKAVHDLLVQAGRAAAKLSELEEELIFSAKELPPLLGQLGSTLDDYQNLARTLGQESQNLDMAIKEFTSASAGINKLSARINQDTLDDTAVVLRSINESSASLTRLLEDIRQDPQRLLLGSPNQLGPGESIPNREQQ